MLAWDGEPGPGPLPPVGVFHATPRLPGMNKEELRERIWDRLETEGVARFPYPPHGRIPNFVDASAAAARLAATTPWARARTIKCNPDAPQLPVRRRALRAGKTLFVAVPRLREPAPFLRIAPDEIDDIDAATTVAGAAEHGVPVAPEEMPPVDLIVAGSVAVDTAGNRVGKGEGYSDLEFGVLRAFDRVEDTTAVVSTVHELQVVEDGVIAPAAHDVPLDLLVTPDRMVQTEPVSARPAGLFWEDLTAEKIAAIPVLQRLQPR